ncbi:PADRE domain [Dillenia turbinata]|uniref:PADRE domain n=1 Tax=Dillenia turbinata TaxID=194707 RepID=A0AAN8Z7K6_9MAGN
MGNSMVGRRKAKVMMIDGETFKLKTPSRVWDVIKDYPGHVLLESGAVKRFGIRAQPMEPQEEVKPKRVYFLVELPKFPDEKVHRRVQSGVHVSAEDRLECLILARRSISDLTLTRSSDALPGGMGWDHGSVRVKMRLPKAQLDKLMEESKDKKEVAEKIMDLYFTNPGGSGRVVPSSVGNSILVAWWEV